LPVQIQRIDIADPNRAENSEHHCTAQIHKRTEDAYVGSVVCAGADGETLERLIDYHAKIIERREQWPTAEQLSSQGAVGGQGSPNIIANGGGWDGGVHYRDVPAYGPQQQMAFFLRFPLTAQECQGPNGTVNFTNYYRWAGKTRELGTINTPGAYSQLIGMLASQDLTAATNAFETKILGLARPNDMIEVRYWAEKVTRADADAIYEWWRIPFPPGSASPEMIAWSKMKTSAVKVVDHGRVLGTEWPDFFFQFLNAMGPRTNDPTPEPSALHDMGERLYSSQGVSVQHAVHDSLIETSLEDANVVGNIYFANYGVWQGRARDRFLHRIAPRLFDRTATQSMVHCVATGTYHVHEAMPFDRIGVRTYISAVYDRGLRLEFDFVRLEDGKPNLKLARGFHEATWVPADAHGVPQPTPWPTDVREMLLALAMEQSAERVAS
jgi:acyl-CoA thioesterase FadM